MKPGMDQIRALVDQADVNGRIVIKNKTHLEQIRSIFRSLEWACTTWVKEDHGSRATLRFQTVPYSSEPGMNHFRGEFEFIKSTLTSPAILNIRSL